MSLSSECDDSLSTTMTPSSQIQAKRSDSAEPSCVSMKSNVSMDHPLHFKNGDPSPEPSQICTERSHSPVSSCTSKNSMDHPFNFKNEDPSSGHSQIQAKRSDSPEPSCFSMKSNVSMDHPLHFKNGDPSPEPSEIQPKRSDSPEPSCLSMKSNESIDHPMNFKNGDPSPKRRPGPLPAGAQTQIHLKANLKKKFQCLNEVITSQKSPALLSEIYTELYITDSEEVSNEHEVRQTDATSRRKTTADAPIKCSEIFKSLSGQDKPIRTLLTTGAAGMGKTVSVQKFILDWAEDTANQDVHLIFPLPFRELNLMKDQELSLIDVLYKCVKETKEIEISSLHKVLFIFDGLDECCLPLDFQNSLNLFDETESASVEVLLINLIKGNLLPSALIWITSRPAAADQIPSEYVDRVTEVRGFTDPQKEEYFRKRISNQNLTNRMIKHLKASGSLYIMCHIPVFCWISATVLERMLGEAESGETPRTLTQMYTHFLIIQTKIIREKYTENQTNEEILLKLGQLAYQQLMKGNLIFYEEDLRECGIDVQEASVYSGVCTQIFREESGLHQSKVYCFVHLSIQEHLAALYVHLMFMIQKRNVLKKSQSSKVSILKRKETILDVHRSAVDQALQSENGHLDLFLRFLLGLSVESNQTLLHDFVTQTQSSSHSKMETVQYIKKKMKENPSVEKSISLFHCLNELDDRSLAEEVQLYLQSGNLQSRTLTRSQWSAVVFVLLTSTQQIDLFDLNKYIKSYSRTEEVLLKMLPVAAASRKAHFQNCNLTKNSCASLASVLSSELSVLRELDLSENELTDSGVELLSAGLRNPHCKLQTLRLCNCKIQGEGCAALDLALTSNPSHLRELDLSWNEVEDSGVKLLLSALEKCQYKLETLRLWDCKITAESCAALDFAQKSIPSHLRVLDLSKNKLEDSGVKSLMLTLNNSLCKLEKLRLLDCCVSDEGCAALASFLNSNPSDLKELDLSQNKLSDSGVKLLSVALGNPLCKLKSLRLLNCDIRHEGCAAMALALKSNPSHLRELDLSWNDLEDSGVKLLSDVLESSLCKLEKLRLCKCNITDEGCTALASALKSNPSCLKDLDLSENKLGAEGVKLLFALKDDEDYQLQQLSVKMCMSVWQRSEQEDV